MLSITLKENRDSIVKFDEEADHSFLQLIQFFCDTNKFVMLRKVLKMLMILPHGKATIERGFSVNGKLLVENLDTESLIARRYIHDHMHSYDLQAHNLDIAHELLDSISSTRKCYFQSQKERSLAKEKSSKDFQLVELNEISK